MNTVNVLFIKPDDRIQFSAKDVPLGSMYLSAYLKAHLGEKVKTNLVDLRNEKHKQKALIKHIAGFPPDIVGISMMNCDQPFLYDYLPLIRKHAPFALIIVGGPFASSFGEKILEHDAVDLVVKGEGERTFLNLVKCAGMGLDYREVRGIAYRSNNSIVCTEPESYIEDLDSIPFPDYDLIAVEKYWGAHQHMNQLLAEKRHTHIISSRGCPYHCAYCHNIFGKKTRMRSPENFVSEIKMLYHRFGIKEFHIVDDIFNLDRKRMHRICELIIESPMDIRISFPNALRGDILEYEDLDILKKAGTYMVTLAVESSSKRMQKMINKHLDIDKVSRNISYARKIGLLVKGYFMLGFPGETLDEIKQTIRFAVRSDLHMAAFFVVVPQPGTALHKMAVKNCAELQFSYDYHSKNSYYQQATGCNVTRLREAAVFRFYHPVRILQIFLRIPRKGYFLYRYVKSFFRLLQA